MVTLAVPDDGHRPALVTASGYLVPRSEQRTITACSWGSSKWAQWRVPGQVVLRISAGRDGDEHALDLDDDDLTAAVLSDLDRHVGLRGQPTAIRITRWWQAMPQYAPGHVERVDALMAALARRRSGPPPGRRRVPRAGAAGLHRPGPGCGPCRAGHGRSGVTACGTPGAWNPDARRAPNAVRAPSRLSSHAPARTWSVGSRPPGRSWGCWGWRRADRAPDDQRRRAGDNLDPPPPPAAPTTTIAVTLPITTATTTAAPTTIATTTTAATLPSRRRRPSPTRTDPAMELGSIEIPKIGVDRALWEGVTLHHPRPGPGPLARAPPCRARSATSSSAVTGSATTSRSATSTSSCPVTRSS